MDSDTNTPNIFRSSLWGGKYSTYYYDLQADTVDGRNVVPVQFGGYHLIGFQHISTILLLVQNRMFSIHSLFFAEKLQRSDFR